MAIPPDSSRSPAGDGSGTADRILDAAEALFAERGFVGAPIRDIAARVGLNPASLYNHFAGKQALYEAVLERGMRPIFSVLEEAATADNASATSQRILRDLVTHLTARPSLPRLIQHELLSGGAHLTPLIARWIRPMYARGLAALERSPDLGGWERDELPLVLIAYHHLLIGHFAMAPVLGEALDEDLMSPEAVERQTRFLSKVTERLLGLGAAQASTPQNENSR